VFHRGEGGAAGRRPREGDREGGSGAARVREGGVRPGVSAQAGPRFSPGGGSGAARVREGGVRPGVSAQAGPRLSPGGGSGGSPGYREAEEPGRRASRGPHDGGRAQESTDVARDGGTSRQEWSGECKRAGCGKDPLLRAERAEGKDPPGGGGSQPWVTSSETASKLGIRIGGPPWGPRETNDDLNQHRHEHDLGRGLFLGEGIRGYRRRIRGGAAD